MNHSSNRGAWKIAKNLSSIAMSLLMVFQALGPGVLALKTANATVVLPSPYGENPITKVDVCHYNSGHGGSYNDINVDVSSSGAPQGGHDSHSNDIIPPYYWSDGDTTGYYPGKNWTADGQAIFNNNCVVPEQEPANGHLIVHKVTDPANNATVFSVTLNATPAVGDATRDISTSADVDYEVVPGTYSVTETSMAGWDETGNTCNDVEVASGQNAECTITNTHVAPPQEESDLTLTVTKIVCDNESDLPNWGDGLNGAPDTILSDTGTNFLATHPNCHLEPNWHFETAYRGPSHLIGDPVSSNSDIGAAGGDWVTMPNATNQDGVTTVTFAPDSVWHLWVREVLQAGYIPFSGGAPDPSAEMYCGSDVTNYDNIELINGPFHPGDHYYCVAFNVPDVAPPAENSCTEPTTLENGDKVTTYGQSLDGAGKQLQDLLDNAGYTINTFTDDTGYQAWNIPSGTASVTLDAKLVNSISANTNTFGYYTNGDISTFTPLFSTPPNVPGSTWGPTVIDTTGVTSIAFAIKSNDGNTVKTYSTQYDTAVAGTDNSGDDHAVVFNPSENKYVIGFEDLPIASSDKDYQDMIVEVNLSHCTGPECVPGDGEISSGTDTMVTSITDPNTDPTPPFDAVLVSTVSDIQALGAGVWGALTSDPNAKWIWSEDPVSDWTTDKSVVFEKDFNITGNPTGGTLEIAADNSYEVWVNGNIANPADFSDPTENNHSAIDTYDVSSLLQTGNNTLQVRVKNWGLNDIWQHNPGGLLYTLKWTSDCDDGGGGPHDTPNYTVTFHKYINGEPADSNSTFTVDWGTSESKDHNVALNSGDSFTSSSDPIVEGSSVSWGEEVGGEGNDVVPFEECSPGKYYLDGYSWGETLEDAIANKNLNQDASIGGIGHDEHVVVWNKACPAGAIKITKYICPADTIITRGENGPSATDIDANTYTVPEGCEPQSDAKFGYTYDSSNSTNNTGPFLGLFGDSTPFTPFDLTDTNGITELLNAPTVGRYIVVELDSEGNQLPADQMLGLYCYGDGDTSGTNDNQEITFSVDGKVSNCVAYNKSNGGGGIIVTDPALVKTVDNGNPAPGATITYTLVVSNTADVDATNVVVNDPFPTGVTYQSDDAAVDADTVYNGGTNTLVWTIPTIAAHGSVTLHITAKVDGDASGDITNTASIVSGADQGDSDTTNDSSAASVVVSTGGGGGGGSACTVNCDSPHTPSTPGGGGGGGGGGFLFNHPPTHSGNGGGQVLGASIDVPGLPNTGNGTESQAVMTVFALIVSLFAINFFAIRRMQRN